ncbi:MAG: zinc ribbon domain-containing protein [Mycobacterium sp.]|nr:zinc ribbon domain-containing protein [Mycobacterium sp.]
MKYTTRIGGFGMARYSYSCDDHGLAEVSFPIGTAPQERDCPQCDQPAKRVYSSPMLSAVDHQRMNLIDSTHETADRPEVVTSIPRGGRINSRPTRMAPPDPRLQKLPRP